MRHLLLDTSVVIKWFHQEEGSHAARDLRAAHIRGDVSAHVIDLALYEIGNVLARALRWSAGDVADQLADVATLLGAPLLPGPGELRLAADLAGRHGLSFYDAAWAAAARSWDMTLVTADRLLLASELGVSIESAAELT